MEQALSAFDLNILFSAEYHLFFVSWGIHGALEGKVRAIKLLLLLLCCISAVIRFVF